MRATTANSPRSPTVMTHLLVPHRVRWPFGVIPIAREDVMVQAYILIQTEVGKAAAVAVEIASISGVTDLRRF